MTDIPCKTGNLRSTEITIEKIDRRLFRHRDDLHVKEPLVEVKITVSPGNRNYRLDRGMWRSHPGVEDGPRGIMSDLADYFGPVATIALAVLALMPPSGQPRY